MHEERDNRDRHDRQTTIRIITLGTFLILHKEHGQWEPVRDAVLAARGPSLAFVKILVSSGPSMDSHKRASGRVCQEWERHEASRDTIIDALWPEEEAVSADPDNAVSVAKSTLNRALRPYAKEDVIVLTDGTDKVGYRLNTQVVEIDADEFERCVHLASKAEGRGDKEAAQLLWERAHGLVQGEYLPHDAYNDWSTCRRNRLHGKYQMTLHRLSWLYAERGRTSEAIELLHPHLLAYPTDLDALCVLLPLMASQGRYEEAHQMLAMYRSALQEEGKTAPPKLREIEARLVEAQEELLTEVSLSVLSSPPKALIVSGRRALPSPLETSTIIVEQGAGDGFCLPPAFTTFPSSTLPAVGEPASWFDLKQKLVCALVMQWRGRAMYCDELQAIIDQELWMFDLVKSLYTQEAYTMSRRSALVAIAALPAALLAATQQQRKEVPAPEEFLPACAASLSACWQLMNGKEIAAVERELSRYLPTLIVQARQSSMYQEPAAYLASQGCLLLSLVSLHRYHIAGRLAYCQQAVEHARKSGNPSLLVRTLVHLGDAFHTNGQLPEMLLAYQEAALSLDKVSPRLQSHALAESAHAYALNGKFEETLECLGKARTIFTGETDDAASFLLADTGLFSLILYEGTAYLDLGKRYEETDDREKAHKSYIQAEQALSQIDTLPATMTVPERVRLEIINLRTLAAVKVRNLENFQHFVIQGIEGAKVLQSEKRRQEVITNWKAARQAWPKETKVLELADVLV